MGDGGRIFIWVVVVGVGGYEWTLAVLDVLSRSCSVNWDEDSGRSTGGVGMLVRVLNDMAASVCSTEPADTGVSGINTPGGKVGDRSRMYHPRIGRCIDHSTVLVALCCTRFMCGHESTLYNLYSSRTNVPRYFLRSHRRQGIFPSNWSRASSAERNRVAHLVPDHFI